jgi:hypothetical protein
MEEQSLSSRDLLEKQDFEPPKKKNMKMGNVLTMIKAVLFDLRGHGDGSTGTSIKQNHENRPCGFLL